MLSLVFSLSLFYSSLNELCSLNKHSCSLVCSLHTVALCSLLCPLSAISTHTLLSFVLSLLPGLYYLNTYSALSCTLYIIYTHFLLSLVFPCALSCALSPLYSLPGLSPVPSLVSALPTTT
jgi:hypothetical protein